MSLKSKLKQAAEKGLDDLAERQDFERMLQSATTPTRACQLIIDRLPLQVRQTLAAGKMEIEIGLVRVGPDITADFRSLPLTHHTSTREGSVMRLVCDALVNAGCKLHFVGQPENSRPGAGTGSYKVILSNLVLLSTAK